MQFLLCNLDRPASGPVYDDAYIEKWGEIYLANPPLRLLGVPFSMFLARPGAWLRYIGDPLWNAAALRATAAPARHA